MKKVLLVIYLTIFITNLFAQQIVIKQKSVNSNAPFNDDSSLYPDRYGVYLECEKPPMFPGGFSAYKKFISKNLKWPDKSGMIDVRGKVIISFIVEKNGTLTNFKVERKLDSIFDNAAIATLKISPKWIPGKVNGHIVRAKYFLPFDFSPL